MGTWGTDPFGNDTACDWVYDLEETSDLSLIRSTLEYILENDPELVSSHEGDQAIAAADTVARLNGKFYVRNSYTQSLDEWVEKTRLTPSRSLVDLALKALDRITTKPSESVDLWEESDSFEERKQQIEALKNRLR